MKKNKEFLFFYILSILLVINSVVSAVLLTLKLLDFIALDYILLFLPVIIPGGLIFLPMLSILILVRFSEKNKNFLDVAQKNEEDDEE